MLVPNYTISPITCGPRFFEFAEEGPRAVVTDVTCDGRLEDRVAWFPGAHGKWWVQTGQSIFLGEDEIIKARWRRAPLLLHPTPASWVIAECKGAVILDWNSDFYPALMGLTDLRCSSKALAIRVREKLERPRIAVGIAAPGMLCDVTQPGLASPGGRAAGGRDAA